MNKQPLRLLAIIFGSVLILDQLTKNIVLSYMEFGQSVSVWGDWIRLTLVLNPGGAFSIRLGNTTYYLIASIIIFAALVYFIYSRRYIYTLSVPLTFVAGGAAGNIIDRFRFREVVDFIDCDFFNINLGSFHMDRWPIFNVADMAISCGIVATIILSLYFTEKSENDTKAPDSNPSID